MTKAMVIGGTGYAGAHIVAEAATRGLEVTSISRHIPEHRIASVTYAIGDLVSEVPNVSGYDVVVAALSPRGSNAGQLRAAYAKLAKATAAAGARLVVIGGFGSLRPKAGEPRFAQAGAIPAEFSAEALEMSSILGDLEISDSDTNWLFVSPAGEFGAYNPGEKLGHYRVGGDVAVFDAQGKSSISGADFATAVVDEIEKPTVRNGQIGFAY